MKEFFQNFKKKLKEQTSGVLVTILITLFVIVYLWQRIFITILPGQAGVLWSRFFGGTQVDYIYPEGMQYIYPWDRMYVYNVRVQQTPHEFDVLTKNGLKIHLFISIRYYPEYHRLGVLHQTVGPDYVEKVVVPEVEAVLRVLIGQLDAQQVYTTKQAIIEKALNTAVEQVAQRYVNIDDVIIKQIVMPPMVERAIQEKIQQKHLADAHLFKIEREKREAERKRIEARAFQRYNQILAASLTQEILRWRDIQATLELSKSTNTKVVVIGSAKDHFQLFGDISLVPPEYPESSTMNRRDVFSNMTGGTGFPNVTGVMELPGMSTDNTSVNMPATSGGGEVPDIPSVPSGTGKEQ